jgi:hypothetical protein
MALTSSQIESFRLAGEALQERKPVLLTGNSNGKTTILHSALEVLGQRDERTGGYSSNPKHPEDRTIDFHRVYIPSYATVPSMMRQIMTFAKIKPKGGAANVVMRFDEYMRDSAKNNRSVCLAVDNAEMLGPRAYTILKALHEYHDPISRKSIGTGLLIAGDITKLKRMPSSFMLRATEILVGKVGAQEIVELIDALHPGNSHWFDEGSIKRLIVCRTTLQMKSVIERCVADRKRYRLTQISPDLIEEKLADLPTDGYKLALAA